MSVYGNGSGATGRLSLCIAGPKLAAGKRAERQKQMNAQLPAPPEA